MTHGNELAFPFNRQSDTNAPGLTKKEYFAALALQGILANPNIARNSADLDSSDFLADHAVNLAGALINELNKE
jgi:hypothetical protein